jgi:TRAP-type uncharacterized transport system substrate-binding protein
VSLYKSLIDYFLTFRTTAAAIAITAILAVMDTFPPDKLYQIIAALFSSQTEISAVWKDALKWSPERAVRQVTPDSIRYLHPGSQRFFRRKAS